MDKKDSKSAYAELKQLRITARKVRIVAAAIRNKRVNEAITILKFSRRRSAQPLLKLLMSALNNATSVKKLNANKLYVDELLVNEGPTYKRIRPRAKGRAFRILKRTSKIKLTLAEREA